MGYAIEKEALERYVFFAVLVLLFIVSFFILRPYLVALLSAFVLGFLVKPVHKYFSKRVGVKFAAAICMVLLLLILFIPLGMVLGLLVSQAYGYVDSNTFEIAAKTIFDRLGIKLDAEILDTINREALTFIISLARPLVSNAVSFILVLFVMFFALYYVLVYWDFLAAELTKFVPFKDREKVTKELSVSTREIVFGTLLIGLIEFCVAFLGFHLLGIDSALLLAALIFFTAFIPAVGPGFVWVPLAVYLFLIGDIWVAVGVVVLGYVIGIGIDLMLRGVLIGKKSSINPLIILLGIFGGVPLFGLFGFVIGPLILVYAIKFLQEIVGE